MGMFVDVNRRIQHTPKLPGVPPSAVFTLRALKYTERCERIDLSRGPQGGILAGTYNLFTLRRGIVNAQGLPPEFPCSFSLDSSGFASQAFLDVLTGDLANDLISKIDSLSEPSPEEVKV